NFLRRGVVPTEGNVNDGFGYASGALEYPLAVPAGGAVEVHVAVPMHDGPLAGPALEPGAFDKIYDRTVADWKTRLGRVEFQVPKSEKKFVDALQSTIAYTLINRDRRALQPGSRTYARSWIRDGALTVTGLLETGSTEEPREFIEWF